ncbi:MAG: sulfotransferase domain-containing protein [Gemmatimonadota bacterium]
MIATITPRWLLTRAPRRLTGRLRATPDFLVVGGQRCGTTSLYHSLLEHPLVLPARAKEVHYFDHAFERGPSWYRSNFPLSARRFAYPGTPRRPRLTGEATPYYIFHPLAPERIAESLPEVRVILLLRDPVDRARSHYEHEVRIGAETLSFEEAIEAEPERLEGEEERLRSDPTYRSFNHQHYSYLARGRYVKQIRNLHRWFPEERVLILKSETFYRDPAGTVARVHGFLGLPEAPPPAEFPKHHLSTYAPMASGLRARLNDYFRSYNEALCALLGEEFRWGEPRTNSAEGPPESRS